MLFNSFEFLVFFIVVTTVFFALPHKLRWLHLLLASFVFYMAFLPIYVFILLITIVIDYFAGIYIERAEGRKRKRYLVISILANVGFLCLFKYYDFIVGNLNDILPLHIPYLKELWLSEGIIHTNNIINTRINGVLGTDLPILENIILPIGLSFHTFQAMSYTIEVYRGNQKAERKFGIYALYVMFYPQLVAGPIERPQNVLHQFHERKYFSAENLAGGIRLMLWGLFKKVVIADRLSVYIDMVYADPGAFHWLNVLLATLLFGVQVYCDFSGYSDMAIGAAKTMGFDLMTNFKRPLFATNIKNFWERWHISLTSWFRDYLYIPMGGNRVSFNRLLLNIATVFVVSGVWHGANWTYVIFGFLHAAFVVGYLLFSKYMNRRGIKMESLFWKTGGWLLAVSEVTFSWFLFRAKDIHQSWVAIKQVFTLQAPQAFKYVILDAQFEDGFGLLSAALVLVFGSFMFWVEKHHEPRLGEFSKKPIADILFMGLVAFAIITFGAFTKESFIYFQF